MTRNAIKGLLLATSILGTAGLAQAQDVTLTVESWRNDDLSIWQEKIIPAFEAKNPGIKVVFAPTAPTEYNAALNAKLDAGSAGDLITCRPFDASLELFNKGHLAGLNDLSGMENFSDVAKSAWTTDDGATTFCVPMASVIHGFIYNKDAFDQLGCHVVGWRTDNFNFASQRAIERLGARKDGVIRGNLRAAMTGGGVRAFDLALEPFVETMRLNFIGGVVAPCLAFGRRMVAGGRGGLDQEAWVIKPQAIDAPGVGSAPPRLACETRPAGGIPIYGKAAFVSGCNCVGCAACIAVRHSHMIWVGGLRREAT